MYIDILIGIDSYFFHTENGPYISQSIEKIYNCCDHDTSVESAGGSSMSSISGPTEMINDAVDEATKARIENNQERYHKK